MEEPQDDDEDDHLGEGDDDIAGMATQPGLQWQHLKIEKLISKRHFSIRMFLPCDIDKP